MSMKKFYTCDLCKEGKAAAELVGLNFSNLTKFKFDTADSTDGTHICQRCLAQIREEFKKEAIEYTC